MREKILQVKTFGSFSMIYDGKSLFGRKVGETQFASMMQMLSWLVPLQVPISVCCAAKNSICSSPLSEDPTGPPPLRQTGRLPPNCGNPSGLPYTI